MSDGGARPTRPAGFWIRLVAVLVDGVVVSFAQWSMTFVAARVWGREIGALSGVQGLVAAFTLLFWCVYSTAAHAATGQTIGKALVGARVVAVDGAPLAAGAALLRWFALALSALPLGLGFIMAGLRTDKRALHDLIAGSRVERTATVRAERHTPAPCSALGSNPPPSAEPPAAVPWPHGGPRGEPPAETPPAAPPGV
ncbi:MAG: RDD family protein [Candidatus Rokuibacteriota bacterium]